MDVWSCGASLRASLALNCEEEVVYLVSAEIRSLGCSVLQDSVK